MPHSYRFAAAALLTLWSASAATDPLPSAVRVDAWNRFAAVAGASAAVCWSPGDGVPVSVRAVSGSALPGFSSDRAAAVRSMFLEHANLFRLRSGIDDFHAIGERESHGIHHLRMSQTYHGIPVHGGQYMVSVGSEGRLRMMSGRVVPEVDSDVTAAVSERRAIKIA